MEINATLFIQLCGFLLLLGLLSEILFAPLLEMFDEREKRIVGAAETAKSLSSSTDDKARLIEEKLTAAQAEARAALAEIRQKGAAKQQALIDAAKADAQKKLEAARAELEKTSAEVQAGLKADVDKLANEIVETVLGRAA